MKFEKWNEKAAKILDKILADPESKARFYNDENGVLFTENGFVAFKLDGYNIMSARNDKYSYVIKKAFDSTVNGKLAVNIIPGVSSCRADLITKLENGENHTYIATKYFKLFPKNALFYISAWNEPVLVCLDTFNGLKEIAIIMPIAMGIPGKPFFMPLPKD